MAFAEKFRKCVWIVLLIFSMIILLSMGKYDDPKKIALHLEGGSIVTSGGQTLQLSCMRLGCVNCKEDLLPEMLPEGVNTVLVTVCADGEDGYVSDETGGITTRLDNLIAKAAERGLYCIVEWSVESDEDPDDRLGNAMIFFDHVSQKNGRQGNVIYAVRLPESRAWEAVKTYDENLAKIIRGNDADSLFIAEAEGQLPDAKDTICMILPEAEGAQFTIGK